MPRVLEYLAEAPDDKPVYFSKYDVSDGYWHMVLQPGKEWNFAYVLSQSPGEPVTLVIPSAIQMGWEESPGYFCSASEMARDVIATLAGLEAPGTNTLPEHPSNQLISFPSVKDDGGSSAVRGAFSWVNIEAFIDDFMMMTQEKAHYRRLTCAALHGIQSVFPPLSVTRHKEGKEPVSVKKLRKGEADWVFEKQVLGWLLDGVHWTISLPPDKAADYRRAVEALAQAQESQAQGIGAGNWKALLYFHGHPCGPGPLLPTEQIAPNGVGLRWLL